jgi:integrase
MRLYKPKYRDRHGTEHVIDKWHLEFYYPPGQLHRLAAFKDKRASEELGRNVQRLIDCRISGAELDHTLSLWLESLSGHYRERIAEIGLLDARNEAAGSPLDKHLADYKASLVANGRVQEYVDIVVSRIRVIFDKCRFRCFSDISPEPVHRFLAQLRDGGKGASIETSNQYLRSLKQFCNWMVRNNRAKESPVTHMQGLNSALDQRRRRRALTPDECARLIDAAKNGPIRWSMPGPERALLYGLALETGLRANELRSLTKASFNLDADPPTVTVRAVASKHKREDVLPLRPELAHEIRIYTALRKPDDAVFTAPESSKSCWRTAMMIKADLQAAGIPYIDATGKVADFHSLRHTFITNLAMSGVHPRIAQALARHSSIELTMNRYTHVAMGNMASALSQLPNISTKLDREGHESIAATGTNGKPSQAD